MAVVRRASQPQDLYHASSLIRCVCVRIGSNAQGSGHCIDRRSSIDAACWKQAVSRYVGVAIAIIEPHSFGNRENHGGLRRWVRDAAGSSTPRCAASHLDSRVEAIDCDALQYHHESIVDLARQQQLDHRHVATLWVQLASCVAGSLLCEDV